MKKEPKLIREINEITNNEDLHFWIKCKLLSEIETYNRPGNYKGEAVIGKFFAECAGRFHDRFESAYVRPYLNSWRDRSAYDYVNHCDLNACLASKIGRKPRGINMLEPVDSDDRFIRYLRCKFPEAFEVFREIKKTTYSYRPPAMENTEDHAWKHIFGDMMGPHCYHRPRWGKTTKAVQQGRRELDLEMEKAQAAYKQLKRSSKLPPRYLYNEVSLAELQADHKNHTYAKFIGHYITTDTVLTYDNSDVSFGLGQLKHTSRKLTIRDSGGVVFSKNLKSYGGHFVLNAIEEFFGKTKRIKVPLGLKPVQLNPKMEVKLYLGRGGSRVTPATTRIFQRLFAGVHYDYCLLKQGITFHGASLEKCRTGWNLKNKNVKREKRLGDKAINMESCLNLGFCLDGVRGFCEANQLDSEGSYTINELREVTKKRITFNKDRYGQELRSLGIL